MSSFYKDTMQTHFNLSLLVSKYIYVRGHSLAHNYHVFIMVAKGKKMLVLLVAPHSKILLLLLSRRKRQGSNKNWKPCRRVARKQS
jgi:hypothetical protein